MRRPANPKETQTPSHDPRATNLLANKKKQINFFRGWPHPSLLPTALLQKSAVHVLSTPSVAHPALSYGPDEGFAPLREEIARWLANIYTASEFPARVRKEELDSSGTTAREAVDRICITGGASQNLACALQVFTDPVYTLRVWMVAPCYFLACRIFEDAGLRTAAVPEGETGINLEVLERRIIAAEDEDGLKGQPLKLPTPYSKLYRHVIYCVPTFSNPSGSTMPLDVRIKLVQLARKHDALIISDDVYDFLSWPASAAVQSPQSKPSPPLPRLVDIDRLLTNPPCTPFGNTLSNGTFSKLSGPGLRTGWAATPMPKLAFALSQVGSSRSGGAPSQFSAAVVWAALRDGELQDLVASTAAPAYHRRWRLMIDAVTTHLLPLGVQVRHGGNDAKTLKQGVFGGYFLWLELPVGLDGDRVARRAQALEDLIVAPGSIFEVPGDDSVRFPRALRLCFAWVDEPDLLEGVERLAAVVRSLLLAGEDGDGDGDDGGVNIRENQFK